MTHKEKQDRRVVVTGIGLLSGFGLKLDEISRGLREGRSTIAVSEERVRLGFQSPLSGTHVRVSQIAIGKISSFNSVASSNAPL